MIDVALLGIIRRWHLRDQVPLREIARRLGISRNTVRRYLRSEITEPSYAERRASSALDKYSLQLSGWLKAETVKPRKQRRNLKQIHEDLKELGYEGSYDRVAAFARQWKAGQSDRVNSASKRTNAIIGGAEAKIESLVFAPHLQSCNNSTMAAVLSYIGTSSQSIDTNPDRHYIDEIVSKRHQVAHGRTSPANVGASGRSPELELRFSAAERTVELFIAQIEIYFNSYLFLNESARHRFIT